MSRTEVTTDKHGRISLELVLGGQKWAHRNLAEEKPDGTIVLTPRCPASDGTRRRTGVSVRASQLCLIARIVRSTLAIRHSRLGFVEEAHLPAYLNEFAFRFNRRNSRSRGMLFYRVMELAAGHEPIRYADILASRKPRGKAPATRGSGSPPSLERPAANRPWRTTEMQLPLPLRLTV